MICFNKKRQLKLAGCFFVALLMLFSAGCNTKKIDKPNVILISVDTLRADRLGSYGSTDGATPVMDLLAQKGVRFSNYRTSSPWTLPAHASLFTGLYPTEHRAVDDGVKIKNDAKMLTERFKEAGYATGAVVTHYYVGSDYGFQKGFDDFIPRENATADVVADQAVSWVKQHQGNSFFLFLHFFDPHTPYEPPPTLRAKRIPQTGFPVIGDTKDVLDVVHERYGENNPLMVEALNSLYLGEIENVDRALGRFLGFLKSLDMKNTIIVLTSDHGEEFMEHRLMEHGFTLYEQQLRVPLIIYWPEKFKGPKVVDTPASIIDIHPTLLDLTELEPTQNLAGKSLAPLLTGQNLQESLADRVLIAETSRQGPDRVCLITDNKKYIYSPTFRLSGRVIQRELYDLQADPEEKNNLLEKSPELEKPWLKTLMDMNLYIKRNQFSILFGGTQKSVKYEGEVATKGSFISAFKDNVIYDTDENREMISLEFGLRKAENKLNFMALGSDGENGIHFALEPEKSPVKINLLVDDKAGLDLVDFGSDAKRHPTQMPYELPDDLRGKRSFPDGAGYHIRCEEILMNRYVTSRFEIGDQIEMSEDMKKTLKSLGYLAGESLPAKKRIKTSDNPMFEFNGKEIDYKCLPLMDETPVRNP